mgnify:CR=1 FL=1
MTERDPEEEFRRKKELEEFKARERSSLHDKKLANQQQSALAKVELEKSLELLKHELTPEQLENLSRSFAKEMRFKFHVT